MSINKKIEMLKIKQGEKFLLVNTDYSYRRGFPKPFTKITRNLKILDDNYSVSFEDKRGNNIYSNANDVVPLGAYLGKDVKGKKVYIGDTLVTPLYGHVFQLVAENKIKDLETGNSYTIPYNMLLGEGDTRIRGKKLEKYVDKLMTLRDLVECGYYDLDKGKYNKVESQSKQRKF